MSFYPTNIANAEQILELAKSFKPCRILLSAVELDIFTTLNNDQLTSKELSEKLKTNWKGTERLINALCGMGFLRKTTDKYSNTNISKEYLVKGNENFMNCLMHYADGWDSWNNLTDSIITGKNVSNKKIRNQNKEWFESFISAMNRRGIEQANNILPIIDLSNVKSVLDVGGGSAVFSIAFINKKSDINVTVFDLPNVIEITKIYVEKENLSDNFDYIEGNYLTDDFRSNDFGSGYDMIFLSAIIHINSDDENQTLLNKCVDVLNPNGQIIILDYIMKEDRINPTDGAIFALNMLTRTEKGNTYTESEIHKWMDTAGLKHIKKRETGLASSLMIGIKN